VGGGAGDETEGQDRTEENVAHENTPVRCDVARDVGCPALMPEQLPAFTETISAASGHTSPETHVSADLFHDAQAKNPLE